MSEGLSTRPRARPIVRSKLMEVPAGGGETILIVEDDELVRPSVESLIESLGYRVLSARNGPDALEILRQDTPIDLLFTDVFMPGGMYGPKLVAEARRLRPQLKILYTSGYGDFTPEPGIERLIKPYWPEHLAAKLREVLESHA